MDLSFLHGRLVQVTVLLDGADKFVDARSACLYFTRKFRGRELSTDSGQHIAESACFYLAQQPLQGSRVNPGFNEVGREFPGISNAMFVEPGSYYILLITLLQRI